MINHRNHRLGATIVITAPPEGTIDDMDDESHIMLNQFHRELVKMITGVNSKLQVMGRERKKTPEKTRREICYTEGEVNGNRFVVRIVFYTYFLLTNADTAALHKGITGFISKHQEGWTAVRK